MSSQRCVTLCIFLRILFRYVVFFSNDHRLSTINCCQLPMINDNKCNRIAQQLIGIEFYVLFSTSNKQYDFEHTVLCVCDYDHENQMETVYHFHSNRWALNSWTLTFLSNFCECTEAKKSIKTINSPIQNNKNDLQNKNTWKRREQKKEKINLQKIH